MRQSEKTPKSRKITVAHSDHERLTKLATGMLERLPDLADGLLTGLEKAKVVADASLPAGIVRMGSSLEYEADDGQKREVTLVYPADADIAQGRISILTPIGVALFGLPESQSMTWASRDGRRRQLTVLSVRQAETVPA